VHRFYLPSVAPVEEFPLTPEDSRKAIRVLKLAPGETIQIWDSDSKEYDALITKVTGLIVYAQVLSVQTPTVESPLPVVLVQGIPKGDKMELIIQKATEVGARMICPLVTERTVVKLTPERRRSRRERWQTIAKEASRQCGRVHIPEVYDIRGFAEIWSVMEPEAVKLLCWESETTSLKKYLRNHKPTGTAPVYLVIGPEGGLSAGEVETAREYGAVPVSLGPRILRTETAGLVALSLVLYEWGDLGGV